MVTQWSGRMPTETESQRRRRRGHRAEARGHVDPIWAPVRNGLPVRPYIYRGDRPLTLAERNGELGELLDQLIAALAQLFETPPAQPTRP
jgi:hypothetical protein